MQVCWRRRSELTRVWCCIGHQTGDLASSEQDVGVLEGRSGELNTVAASEDED